MVSNQEAARVRRFVCDQLRDEPDLSKLSLGILKKRYLALEGLESLNPHTRNYMKQVVEEELMKMQDVDENGGEQETKKPQNKRKREQENDEVKSGTDEEDESRAKKSRCQSSSSSESEDEDGCKTGSEKEDQSSSGSEDTVGKVKKPQQKTNAKQTQRTKNQDSSDEEVSESGKNGDESDCGDSPKERMKQKGNPTSGEMKRSSSLSPGKKKTSSGEEDESETDKKNDKLDCNESSDDNEKDEKVPVQKKNNETDSDSSSLTSLEDDDQKGGTENRKKKTVKKERESTRGEKEDNKTVVRLKRYIALCGVKRNYKKLLSGCRSVRSMVTALKKELEDLGVQGQPSIKKCKSARMKREEAQEVAELDVSNIIATQGRPKRRGASASWEQHDPLSSTYKRTLHSGSDSDQENDKSKGHRRTRDWANLQGIISDDADSD
ncbi:HIRA-interacting protein 3 [Solea solea]|uniref:HIRA-interacting protein 3 n=1 Tax=Solea solea TaxID=90069 RepID=UPI0027297EF3|nr:HIRA-interacting protein 3 [Solea solea]